jgi:hypothetical protein
MRIRQELSMLEEANLPPELLADWLQVCARTRTVAAERMRRAQEGHCRVVERLADLRAMLGERHKSQLSERSHH